MTSPLTFDAVGLAGGGNRCYWQSGFLKAYSEHQPLTPRFYVSVSAGAYHGAMHLAGVGDRVQFTQATAREFPGSDYDLTRLQQAQQRILDSGYFDAVFVYVEPTIEGGELPVKVQLREARRQRLVLGVGGSTDNGARLSIEHTHNRVPGIDWRAQTTLRFERQDSLARTEWSSMPDSDGWRWVGSAQGARQEDGSLTTTSQRLRAGQSQDGLEYDRSIYLQYDRARAFNEVLNLPDNGRIESSITANYAWSRQRFDDPITPNRGHGLALEVGAGSTLGIEHRIPFGHRFKPGNKPLLVAVTGLHQKIHAQAVRLSLLPPSPGRMKRNIAHLDEQLHFENQVFLRGGQGIG